jgi:hypothetical protein
MIETLVICFRFPDLGAVPEVHFSRARELIEQAAAHGGRPIATGIELYAFELEPDALEDAIDLAVAVARRGAPAGILATGLSEGILSHAEVSGERLSLSWGPPLAHAALLACTAEPGEVLVDAALGAAQAGLLTIRGARTAAHAGVRVHGFLLDRDHPFKPTPKAEAEAEAVELPSSELEPLPDSEEDIDLLSSVPPQPSPGKAAVAALRTGDLDAVERMAAKVRHGEGRAGLADRLDAMADLARGETADAIRRLQAAADKARRDGSRDRCRASLAFAVALAAGGRPEDALFQALDALARARESEDVRGEQATLRFLSQLAGLAGRPEIGSRWAALVEPAYPGG